MDFCTLCAYDSVLWVFYLCCFCECSQVATGCGRLVSDIGPGRVRLVFRYFHLSGCVSTWRCPHWRYSSNTDSPNLYQLFLATERVLTVSGSVSLDGRVSGPGWSHYSRVPGLSPIVLESAALAACFLCRKISCHHPCGLDLL